MSHQNKDRNSFYKDYRVFRSRGFYVSCSSILVLLILLIASGATSGVLSLGSGTIFVFLAVIGIFFVGEYSWELMAVLLNYREYKDYLASERDAERQLKKLHESHIKPKGAARTAMRLARGDHYHLNEDGEIIFDGQTEKAKRKNSESNQ